jgi:hypothetical protein
MKTASAAPRWRTRILSLTLVAFAACGGGGDTPTPPAATALTAADADPTATNDPPADVAAATPDTLAMTTTGTKALSVTASGWLDLDPTNDMAAQSDHVVLAIGRDYHDVSPTRGVILGGGEHGISIAVDVEPFDT